MPLPPAVQTPVQLAQHLRVAVALELGLRIALWGNVPLPAALVTDQDLAGGVAVGCPVPLPPAVQTPVQLAQHLLVPVAQVAFVELHLAIRTAPDVFPTVPAHVLLRERILK